MKTPRPDHPTRRELRRMFINITVEPSGCWRWDGCQGNAGYGSFHWRHNKTSAHRITHMWFVGPIPDGYVVDHMCQNIRCVNPSHLEAVSYSENALRALARKPERDVCKNGHAMTPDNIRLHERLGRVVRGCWACQRIWHERNRATRSAGKASTSRDVDAWLWCAN